MTKCFQNDKNRAKNKVLLNKLTCSLLAYEYIILGYQPKIKHISCVSAMA